MHIPFNRPYVGKDALEWVAEAIRKNHLSSGGEFTKKCERWLEKRLGVKHAILTHSCTAALEMAALLLNIQEGDEVIVPSYTFTSTVNAFVLRGATPVFVDVRSDTLTLDELQVAAAVTPKTKAIVLVHYAGVSSDLEVLCRVAQDHSIPIVEDAAQAVGSFYHGKPLGSFGRFATLSFHETKNIISGEGGALLLNDESDFERAMFLAEKGTNRSRFLSGQVDKYTWVDEGSSYQPSEMIAAFLWSQLNSYSEITSRRIQIWQRYQEAFSELDERGIQRPFIPAYNQANGHLYYLLLPTAELRTEMLKKIRERDIDAVFHYVPLHSSPMGLRVGRTAGAMDITNRAGSCLVRLPLWIGLEEVQEEVIENIKQVVESLFTGNLGIDRPSKAGDSWSAQKFYPHKSP